MDAVNGLLIGAGGHADDIWATLHSSFAYRWGRVDHHSKWYPVGGSTIIGINDPHIRAKVCADLGLYPGDAAWVHPDAKLYVDVLCGLGSHVNYGVTMTRTKIGEHTTISPGVTICGDVTIGDRVFIGAGATICNLVTIGDDAIIGAGAVVLKDVPPNITVMGVPAKRWTGGR